MNIVHQAFTKHFEIGTLVVETGLTGGVDSEEMLLQMKLHGIDWLNQDDCNQIIKHYKHDPENEPGKLHFKDWLHMCCKHASEFSNWDSEYNPFKERMRKGYKSPRLRKEKKRRTLQSTNPWRVKGRQTLSRPCTSSSSQRALTTVCYHHQVDQAQAKCQEWFS